jgi:hypothetical protein
MSETDFGERKAEYDPDNDPTKDYEIYNNGDIEYGSEFTGEATLSKIKEHEQYGTSFVLILVDHELEQKALIRTSTIFYKNEDNDNAEEILYGKKGSKKYVFLDEFFHLVKPEENPKLNQLPHRSVNYNTFRESFNNTVKSMTIKAEESTNAMAKANHSPIFHITNIELLKPTE